MVDQSKLFVDEACPKQLISKVHIHNENGELLRCVLNLNDLKNGSNKCLFLQLLKHDLIDSYFLITRSGRVGYAKKHKTIRCLLNEKEAINTFKTLFYQKTGFDWKDRLIMKPLLGKYAYIDRLIDNDGEAKSSNIPADDGGKTKSSVDQSNMESNSVEYSTLPTSVGHLIDMIFDPKLFVKTLNDLRFDTSRIPLGQISPLQINKAMDILVQINQLLVQQVPLTDNQYTNLSSSFYTMIPTASRWVNKLTILNTVEQLKEKSEMLDTLKEIKLATKIREETSNALQRYRRLNTVITPLTDSKMESIIRQYVENTAHSVHRCHMKIESIYTIQRDAEENNKQELIHKIGNRQLLWHGTRLSNIVSILIHGLKIAEVASTGSMFGRGLYFANCVTKSAQYMSTLNNTSVLLLCEVALGNSWQQKNASNITHLPPEMHSVWGVGKRTPKTDEWIILDNGIIVPMGKMVEVERNNLSLYHDEFIIYNIEQVIIRYIVVFGLNN